MFPQKDIGRKSIKKIHDDFLISFKMRHFLNRNLYIMMNVTIQEFIADFVYQMRICSI